MRRVARWVRPVNAMMAPALERSLRDPDRVFDRMLARAEKAGGATAAIDPAFIDDSRELLHRFAREETVSYMGWIGTRTELQMRLENRLRIRRLIAESPEITSEPIDRPIVVVGLPRTATTLSHKVFAHPEGNRAPLTWEFQHADRADADPAERAKHFKRSQRLSNTVKYMLPVWPVIHPSSADTPEECVLALPHGLHWLTRFRMPGYREWLADRDFVPDYAYLKQFLQVLQHGDRPRRWVLKSPFHLYNLDALLKVFPDAAIVWTHRDPQTVLGSFCSLVETGMAAANTEYDPARIGEDWLDILSWMVEQGRHARTRISPDRLIDVSYHQLTADPYGQLPGIFERLGLTWTEREERNLADVLARPGMRRSHEYSLAYYGLDFDQVDRAFGDYSRMVAAMR